MAHSDFILDGVKIPSVTQVLHVVHKEFLIRWYAKNGWEECERIKREAGEIGARVHDAIAEILNGREHSLKSPNEVRMVELFKQWQVESGYVPVEIERKVVSRVHRYHGTLDSVGHFGNPDECWLFDWKSSSQIDDLYGAQIAAYAEALKEETGRTVVGGGVVRIDKKKLTLEVRQFNDLSSYFETFKACLVIWNFLNKPKRKKAA